MTAMLTGADRDRLIKVLALLSSDRDGERAAAGYAATRMLRDRGLDWDVLIAPVLPAPHRPATPSTDRPETSAPFAWADGLMLVLRHPGMLSPWEAGFFADLRTRRRWTPKQVDVLAKVHARLVAQGAK